MLGAHLGLGAEPHAKARATEGGGRRLKLSVKLNYVPLSVRSLPLQDTSCLLLLFLFLFFLLLLFFFFFFWGGGEKHVV